MSARRTDMHQLQEMIRLHRLGQSRRQIARQLRVGRDTIRVHFKAVANAGLLDGSADQLPGAEALRELFDEHLGADEPRPPQQTSSIERWRPKIEALLAKGATPTPIHDHLRLQEPDYVGSLSAVKRMCLRLKQEHGPKETDVAIPVETAPGEIAQVDFGYAGMRYDPDRGILRKSWLFVMVLGFSRHMFLELVFDQKVRTWAKLHIQAFEFFGGVPAVLVPDNLKAAVIRAAFSADDDPVINRSYRELARYYGFRIDPTPPRAPEKKGKVERGVRFVKHNFFATWDSVDIHEDRRQLLSWNLEIAAKRRHGTTNHPPIELFEEEERTALLPLPKNRWKIVIWKTARLHRDSHVQIDGAFYSAPWRFLQEDLWVRCTSHSIAIHHGDEHLWTHTRVARGKRQTLESHLPEHRRDLRHRSHEHWIERARAIGPEVEDLAREIFGSDDVILKLRQVQSVVQHLEKFPKIRARNTARRGLHFGCINYQGIKRILAKGLDFEPLPGESTREWSRNSCHARKPAETSIPVSTTTYQEQDHGDL